MISMVECQTCIHNFEEIRRYVIETLSSYELLKPNSSDLTWNILTRNNEACGVYFCLRGPRSLCLSAIWETDANSILFYGSDGQRVQKTKLENAPRIELLAQNQTNQAA